MLNPIEEAKFAELKSKCWELGVLSPPEIHIGFQVHDKDGVLVFDDKQRGHSWTRNFYNFLYGILTRAPGGNSDNFGAGYMSGKQVGGTIDYSPYLSCASDSNNAVFTEGIVDVATDNACGIVIGTGDTAFSVDHYTLGTIIAHGASSGQMAYAAMAGASSAYTSGTKTWKATLARIFNNNSGGSITVKETGLYAVFCMYANNLTRYYMVERSVLDPTVPVANGAQLTVTYEISMDFSAID
jgi:hypothetical protein